DGEIFVGIEPEPPHERTTTDVMAETMVNWGVKRVFGMVGHSNLGLADAIRLKTADGDIGYVGVRHEGAAAFAASAYGKLTGKPAACLTIAGPGATNLLTGLWDAKVDRAPVLALTGQVQTQVFGPGAFQDIDLKSAFEAVARFSQPVLNASNHAELMSLACKTAIVERDVSHLIFPDDVQTIASDAPAAQPAGRTGRPVVVPNEEDLTAAAALINEAKRPIIVMGHGALDAREGIIGLAEILGAPVLTTFKGKGLIPDAHPNAAGVLGRSGTPIASWFMNESDLILALGSSFANHTGIEKSKPIIQVDFERMQLGKFHPVALPIWGEIGAFCHAIAPRVSKAKDAPDQIEELAARWQIWRAEKQTRLSEQRGQGVHSVAIFDSLSKLCPADAVIAVDVGNNTYSFGRYFETKGQRVLMSGYLGSIGFGFPAAMGAWAATQDLEEFAGRKVVSISGDGGFGQYAMDFTTAVKYGMDITHILLNNGELGKISKEQRAGEWPVWETGLHNPSFAAYARLCGGKGTKVTDAAELDDAIAEALAHDGPALVEVMSDAELV
ncbi:MAG: thiamine pyrophosphate-binding protein, partial [Alphaproteobacteria bacterium]|nr:thiamine pyrophosphate-binding protein [Alphaproteobacteria bacterium]